MCNLPQLAFVAMFYCFSQMYAMLVPVAGFNVHALFHYVSAQQVYGVFCGGPFDSFHVMLLVPVLR